MSNAGRQNCQLYLVIEVDAAAREHLAAVLSEATVASVLFKPGRGARLTAQAVKPLVDLAQSKHAAALVLDDVALARTLRADGVHLTASNDIMARYEEARGVLGARAIVGADAGGSRHTAMELGEAGADYVAFGADVSLRLLAADDEASEDVLGPLDQREMIAWWSDVFEVPCVAFDLPDAAAAHAMAVVGADFVAVTSPSASSASACVAWFRSMRQAVEHADA